MHVSLQEQPDIYMDILKKELSNKSWLIYRDGHRVVKSSRPLPKIATYLLSIGRLLCLAFLCGWHFLDKASLEWLLTLTTQPTTSKLSDNPVDTDFELEWQKTIKRQRRHFFKKINSMFWTFLCCFFFPTCHALKPLFELSRVELYKKCSGGKQKLLQVSRRFKFIPG